MKIKSRWRLLILCICSITFSSITLGDTFHSLASMGSVIAQSVNNKALSKEIAKLPIVKSGYTYYQLKDESFLFLTAKDVYQTKAVERRGKYCGSIKNTGNVVWVIDLTNDWRKKTILIKLSERMKIKLLKNEDIACIMRFQNDAYFVLTSKRSFFVEVIGSNYKINTYVLKKI